MQHADKLAQRFVAWSVTHAEDGMSDTNNGSQHTAKDMMVAEGHISKSSSLGVVQDRTATFVHLCTPPKRC